MKEFIPDKTKLHPSGVFEKHCEMMAAELKSYWSENDASLKREMIEEAPCSLCCAPTPPVSSSIFMKYRFPYFRCPSCSLVYLSPRPRSEYLDNQYKDGRFANSFKELYLPSADYRMKTIFRERVENIICPRVSSGRLLDIGCSSGHFLKVAENFGFDVYGIEKNPAMALFATGDLELQNVKEGDLEEDSFSLNFFDVVTLWDVLEHVPDPRSLLSIAHKMLKPGGWIFAYTENVESFNAFITGEDSEIFAPDVHIRHYSPKTFRMEFEKAGFKITDVLTKGLDVQHIETTVKLHKEKYSGIDMSFIFKNAGEMQKMIDASGKGDNLRLFAQKR